MELIFRYENIKLLRCEFCKHFKVILIFFSHSWLVVDTRIGGPIYLLNMLSTRSYLFQNTYNIFCKNTISANRHQITYLLLSRWEWICWHSAHNKSEALRKASIDENTGSKCREIVWNPIVFAILICPCLSQNLSLFWIKNSTLSRFSTIQVDRPD